MWGKQTKQTEIHTVSGDEHEWEVRQKTRARSRGERREVEGEAQEGLPEQVTRGGGSHRRGGVDLQSMPGGGSR